MDAPVLQTVLPILLLGVCVVALAGFLLVLGNVCNPRRPGRVKRMPYESGMDPVHDTRRRFNVRFHLLAIAFLVFDVELLFLYPWAVTFRSEPAAAKAVPESPKGEAAPSTSAADTIPAAAPAHPPAGISEDTRPPLIFLGGMVFVGLLILGFIYDWRKGIFEWR